MELKPNRTITWISSVSPHKHKLTKQAQRSGEFLLFERYTQKDLTKEDKAFSASLFKKKIKKFPTLKAVLSKQFWEKKFETLEKSEYADFAKVLVNAVRISLQKIVKSIPEGITDLEKQDKNTQQELLNQIYQDIDSSIFLGYDSRPKLFKHGELDKFSKTNYDNITKRVFTNTKKFCSVECNQGEERILLNNQVPCCWRCQKCKLGSIRTLNQTQCTSCPKNTMSNFERTKCLPYKRIPKRLEKDEKLPLMFASGAGITLCLSLLIIFYLYRDSPIIKASDVKLMFPQLVCHMCLFSNGFIATIPAGRRRCYTGLFITGCFWTISSAITVVKTQKYLSIFNRMTRQTSKEVKQTNFLILSTISICLLVQIALVTVLIDYYGTIYEITRDDENITEYFKCYLFPYRRFIFIYIEGILMFCLIQSYRARHLPTNFNETKFITVAVLTTQVFLLSFLVNNGEEGIETDHILVGLANFSMVIIMYGYKAKMVLFQPKQTKAKVITSAELLESTT